MHTTEEDLMEIDNEKAAKLVLKISECLTGHTDAEITAAIAATIDLRVQNKLLPVLPVRRLGHYLMEEISEPDET